MDIRDALLNRRSIRKFEQKRIPEKDLEMLIDYARIAATGANLQPLKFVLVEREELLGQVFSCTKWAGYLPEAAPQPGEEPMAYIAILTDQGERRNRSRCGNYEHDAWGNGFWTGQLLAGCD